VASTLDALNAFAVPGVAESFVVVCLPPTLAAVTYAVWQWLVRDAHVRERARANRRARLRLKSVVASLARGFRVVPERD
jgi:hypothetical protein